ncbi:B-cell receptor CD22-like [Engraulis encrasicolus]|uniref:B-cell receptor CD22-like n=1 Tax=Engraulis encrasicolus TaxID=184585 RepID=UPI002FCF58AD
MHCVIIFPPLPALRLPPYTAEIPESVILSRNESGTLEENREYTLRCEVKSVAPVENLQIIWYRGDTVMAASTNQSLFSTVAVGVGEDKSQNVTASLTITASRKHPNATYSCAARLNLNATVKSSCNNETCTYTTEAINDTKSNDTQLEVWYGPDIVSNIGNVSLAVGDTLELSCQADANPRATYTWTHNNVTLRNENSSTLHIESVSVDHAGQYVCNVSNTVDSAQATMTVEVYHYLIIKNHSRDESLAAGDMLELFCHVDAKPRDTSYTWTHNNVTLLNENSSTLHIESVSMDDAGQYVCHVSNTIDSAQATMTVEVYHYLRIVNHSVNTSFIAAGDPLELFCHADANPNSTSYTWTHNNVILPNENSNTLHIESVSVDDAGQYVCNVSNTIDSEQATMTVEVYRNHMVWIAVLLAIVVVAIIVIVLVAYQAHHMKNKTGQYKFTNLVKFRSGSQNGQVAVANGHGA